LAGRDKRGAEAIYPTHRSPDGVISDLIVNAKPRREYFGSQIADLSIGLRNGITQLGKWRHGDECRRALRRFDGSRNDILAAPRCTKELLQVFEAFRVVGLKRSARRENPQLRTSWR
jgi:hypothetical protein